MSEITQYISFEDFLKIKMCVGTILEATLNEKAKKPAYILKIDFGALGIKTSSAQITEHYQLNNLIGQQVVEVMNFPVKKVAGITSEVLVLASVSDAAGTVLLHPTQPVPNGSFIA